MASRRQDAEPPDRPMELSPMPPSEAEKQQRNDDIERQYTPPPSTFGQKQRTPVWDAYGHDARSEPDYAIEVQPLSRLSTGATSHPDDFEPRPGRGNRVEYRSRLDPSRHPGTTCGDAGLDSLETVENDKLDINVPPKEDDTPLRLAAHYAGLVLAAMLGTLVRLGFNALGNYPGRVIFPLAWSQGIGCGIMGLANARKVELVWIYPPIATFITTGIAGSITTFSSWMLEGFEAFSNWNGYARGGLYDTIDGLVYSFATILVSWGALYFGEQVSRILPPLPRPRRRVREALAVKQSTDHTHGRTPAIDALVILSAVISYGLALMLYWAPPRSWRHRAVFPILLAPPGAMLRFALAPYNLHARFAGRFPIGTFVANMVAVLVLSGVYVAQRRGGVGATRCDALYALEQGFCGCLSTVSTFVVEAKTIRTKRWTWIYVLGSVVLGHLLVLAVAGGVRWGEGVGPVCRGSD